MKQRSRSKFRLIPGPSLLECLALRSRNLVPLPGALRPPATSKFYMLALPTGQCLENPKFSDFASVNLHLGITSKIRPEIVRVSCYQRAKVTVADEHYGVQHIFLPGAVSGLVDPSAIPKLAVRQLINRGGLVSLWRVLLVMPFERRCCVRRYAELAIRHFLARIPA